VPGCGNIRQLSRTVHTAQPDLVSSILQRNQLTVNSQRHRITGTQNNQLQKQLHAIKENTETLLEASRDVGLEIKAEKTKYMIMSRYQNSGQNQNIRIANESFENVAKFK
jgi:hypothetical protein